ncbi:MAG: hypothetical protein A3G37_03655 [Omnitrophica WOR_2 bacterium RIFCSPLOWO2_12_FULL_46_30]|nr:MAG: hypothetical protein A3G37_03655 [Omnitrophica WOR_2 bacterium RIFCSPLOWO2_12_FULL_46_30]
MRTISKVVLAAIFVLSCAPFCLAAITQTKNVKATVPPLNQSLVLTVSKIIPGAGGTADQWTPATEVDFGTLTHDAVNHMFRASAYYAIDCGVSDNTNAWTLSHTRTSLKKDAVDNLDDNVNVAFVKQTTSADGTQLDKKSFKNSNGKAYTKTQLDGGWLRIYYGVADGSTDDDEVTVVPETKPTGSYLGTITLTLTP